MRTIKFRAWSLTLKRFLYSGIQINLNGTVNISELEEGVIIQQWTGLTDKNGIDVYEGDFIRKESFHSDNVQIYQIVWFNGTIDFNGSEYAQLHSGFAAKLISDKSSEKDGEWTFHKIEDNDIRGIGQEFEFENWGTNGEPETKFCEVIGNIYENPELIK